MKTPQTDDIARGNHVVPTEWAQQLERERDKALSQIVQAECRAERFCQERDIAITTIEDAKRALKATDYEGILLAAMRVKEERDEAREEAERWESSSDAMERAGAEQARRADENREWALKAERERDEARRKLNNLDVTAIHSCHNECQRPVCVLRRERDEARERYATEATEHMLSINRICNERDEAVEALMKIEDLFIDGPDVYADREKMGCIAIEALKEAQ